MKRTLLLFTVAISGFSFGQNVNIPDPTFKAALVASTLINTNGDAEIQVSEAQAYTGSLNASNMGINDLTGIEEFTAITELHCYGNNLITLDVSSNVALVEFYCANNQLTSLTIGAIPNLELIQCGQNSLTSLDVTQLPLLDELNVVNNALSTIDVSQNPLLTRLFCQQNYNSFTSLDLTQNPNLERLFCGLNNISTLDLTQNPNLEQLYCQVNNFSTLNLTQNPALTHLNCYDNGLSSLDVTQNTNLEFLSTTDNPISSFDLTQNLDLESLFVENNSLTALDVTQNIALIEVDCGGNLLTSLDVSQNTMLQDLNCDNNQITSIDVSLNTDLGALDCSDNALTSLYMANGTNVSIFSYLEATNNPDLTCIEVDDAAYSTANWTNIDPTASYSEDCCYLNTTILVNGVTLTAELNTMAYQWVDCDNGNQPIAGATNQSFTPTANGNYACIVDNLICSSTSDCIAVTTVGLNEADLNLVKIYPNPTSDLLNVNSEGNIESIIIVTLDGSVALKSNSSTINISSLDAGTYLVKVTLDGTTITEKVIKQ